MSPRGERAMVPPAEFRSYYGRPILKEPVWKKPDVPLYLTLGGMAGTSAVMAALADATGRPELRRTGRVAAAAGALAGAAALVHDLGRPERFLNMLRVLKVTSPLSVGSWILAPFAALSSLAAVSELTGLARPLGRAAGAGAAVLGPAMSTYTAVLVADTAVPAWHEAYRELPFLFAGSALASGAGAALLGTPPVAVGPARGVAVAGAAVELAAAHRVEHRLGLHSEPYVTGRAGRLARAGRLLTAAGVAAALLGRRSRALSALSGASLLAASLCTRYAVFEAGVASAKDPRYVVLSQRKVDHP